MMTAGRSAMVTVLAGSCSLLAACAEGVEPDATGVANSGGASGSSGSSASGGASGGSGAASSGGSSTGAMGGSSAEGGSGAGSSGTGGAAAAGAGGNGGSSGSSGVGGSSASGGNAGGGGNAGTSASGGSSGAPPTGGSGGMPGTGGSATGGIGIGGMGTGGMGTGGMGTGGAGGAGTGGAGGGNCVTLVSVADARITADNAAQNYGSESTMQLRRWGSTFSWRAVVRFDVGGNVPMSATITSAVLELTVSQNSGHPKTVQAHRLSSSFDEGSVSWNSWSAPGGDFAATATASFDVDAFDNAGLKATFDVRSDVQATVDGGADDGWLLKDSQEPASGGGEGVGFHTKEAGASNRPQLTVCWQ